MTKSSCAFAINAACIISSPAGRTPGRQSPGRAGSHQNIEIFGNAVLVWPACRFLSGLASPAHALFVPGSLHVLSLAVPMFFWRQSLLTMVWALFQCPVCLIEIRVVLLRPIPLATRQQSSVATSEVQETDLETQEPDLETQETDLQAQEADLKAQEADLEAKETDLKAQATDPKAQATDPKAQKTVTRLPEPAGATENENLLPQFSSLQNVLHPGIYRALTQSPFQLKTMSPVQAAVLPLIPQLTQPHDPDNPSPRDLMVKAKTGTGKTLGFLIPAVEARLKTLHRSRNSGKDDSGRNSGGRFASSHAGILIISPTRELATQIANEAAKLVQHLKDIEVHLFVGGEDRRRQLRNFNYGRADIIVATPGRMNDLLESSERVSGSIAHTQTVRDLVL